MVIRFLTLKMPALFCLAMIAQVVAPGNLQAQDGQRVQSKVAGQDTARPFSEVNAELEALNGQIEGLIKRFQTATQEEQAGLREQYRELNRNSMALLPELRVAAVSAYEAAPNTDVKVVNVLMGLLANDVATDHYSNALMLGSLLKKNNSDAQGLNGLIGAAAYCVDDFENAGVFLSKEKQAGAISRSLAAYLDDVETAKKLWEREQNLRKAEAQAADLPQVLLKTSKGDMVIELYENEAPQAVGNFVSLVEKQFYDGLSFHRVLPGFMAQGGCPDGSGAGGPGYNIYCECEQENIRHHFRGTLSMAHAGKNTGGSQFFLTFRRTSHLDGRHTVFGRVIEGIDVLEKIQRRDPSQGGQPEPDRILKAEVLRKRNHEYAPTKVDG